MRDNVIALLLLLSVVFVILPQPAPQQTHTKDICRFQHFSLSVVVHTDSDNLQFLSVFVFFFNIYCASCMGVNCSWQAVV